MFFVLRQLREKTRTSLWIVPGIAAVVAVVLAKTLPIVEAYVPHGGSAWYLFPGQPESARTVLSTIASSMMTFTGLVFSITILVLQLGSSQFSPRVLRTFLANRSTRRAMACFIGTFVYAMALLPEVREADASHAERVPALSVFFAFALVLLSVGVFIQYIHGMAHSIRAVHVVRSVTEDAMESLVELYPEGVAHEPEVDVPRPDGPPDQRVTHRPGAMGGVLAAVDDDALLALAIEHDAVIEVVPSLGDFVVRGGLLFKVWGTREIDADRIRGHLVIEDERTPQQDPAFAFRQLVDIAERALSPGTNDPTTAVQALDRIHELLATLATRRFPDPTRVDDDGRPRLFLPRPDWDTLVHLAFDEIRQYGASSLQVTRRLRAAIDDLLERCPPQRTAVLHLQLRELDRAAGSIPAESDRARSREPSAQGQGAPRDPRERRREGVAGNVGVRGGGRPLAPRSTPMGR